MLCRLKSLRCNRWCARMWMVFAFLYWFSCDEWIRQTEVAASDSSGDDEDNDDVDSVFVDAVIANFSIALNYKLNVSSTRAQHSDCALHNIFVPPRISFFISASPISIKINVKFFKCLSEYRHTNTRECTERVRRVALVESTVFEMERKKRSDFCKRNARRNRHDHRHSMLFEPVNIHISCAVISFSFLVCRLTENENVLRECVLQRTAREAHLTTISTHNVNTVVHSESESRRARTCFAVCT